MIQTLSARQLVDVELALYLLYRVTPDASAITFPCLFDSKYIKVREFTPLQYRLLGRGKQMLAHIAKIEVWATLLELYAAQPERRRAFIISPEIYHFTPTVMGFSRNRIGVLRKMLA